MVITSKNKKLNRYGRSQFRYALTYMVITFVVLVFLNLYCSATSQRLFYQNKQTAMLEKALLASEEVGKLQSTDTELLHGVLDHIPSLKVTQLVVTDQNGTTVYDSANERNVGSPAAATQVHQAMEGYDLFNWNYKNGVMRSEAAAPVYTNDVLVGSVYLLEEDPEQGALLRNLQRTILTITFFLEVIVILFSLSFAQAFSSRLRRIMVSMRILREGNFSHRVKLTGHDELTVLAEEFNTLTDRLQTSESKRRQFVSDASHELKTPLASIKLLADSILQNDMDIDTIREFVSDIGNEAERLNRMSEKLLSLTKGEGESVDADREIVYMAPTVERVAKMLSALAQAGNVEIITELDGDVPILIREDDLYQITFNLAENGIKYNHPGGKLTIRLSHNDECGILTVADTGTGIPEDSLGHIFERFYRVDKARSRASGGSGLGLAIVRNMVQRNQGEIRVESVFGSGTTFTVEFPAFDIEGEPQ
ncbi:MAG: HAMP domain-containing histidine kinase [Ruminococcaceae bacterium]|nr:HAMP domain-containing histidine kinase [Oscillospiraceae bacterium]